MCYIARKPLFIRSLAFARCSVPLRFDSLRRHRCAERRPLWTHEARLRQSEQSVMEWAKLDPDERRRRLRVVRESRKPTVMPVEGASPWHGLLLSTSSDDVWGIVRHNVTPDALRAKRGHHGYAFVRLDLKEPSNSMCFAHGCDVSKAGRPGQDCRHLRLLRRLHTQHVLDGGGGPTTLSLDGCFAHILGGADGAHRVCGPCERCAEAEQAKVRSDCVLGDDSDSGDEFGSDEDDTDDHGDNLGGVNDLEPPAPTLDRSQVPASLTGVLMADVKQLRVWVGRLHLQVGQTASKGTLQAALLQALLPNAEFGQQGKRARVARQPLLSAREHASILLQEVRDQRCFDPSTGHSGRLCALYDCQVELGDSRLGAMSEYAQHSDGRRNIPKVPLARSSVDDILYAMIIAAERKGTVVTPVFKGVYAVLRCLPSHGDWATPSGYNLVKLRSLPRGDHGELCIAATCTCSQYRSSSASMGGKSLLGGGRTCLDILLVMLAETTALSPEDAVDQGGALFAATLQERSAPVYCGDGSTRGRPTEAGYLHMAEAFVSGRRIPEELPRDAWLALQAGALRTASSLVSEASRPVGSMPSTPTARPTNTSAFPHLLPEIIECLGCMPGNPCTCPKCAAPHACYTLTGGGVLCVGGDRQSNRAEEEAHMALLIRGLRSGVPPWHKRGLDPGHWLGRWEAFYSFR